MRSSSFLSLFTCRNGKSGRTHRIAPLYRRPANVRILSPSTGRLVQHCECKRLPASYGAHCSAYLGIVQGIATAKVIRIVEVGSGSSGALTCTAVPVC